MSLLNIYHAKCQARARNASLKENLGNVSGENDAKVIDGMVHCWQVKFSREKGEFRIHEVIRTRLDTCLRLSSIDKMV